MGYSKLAEVKEARKALECLYLEVHEDIAMDVNRRINKAFEAIASQQGNSAEAISCRLCITMDDLDNCNYCPDCGRKLR